ncbi:MAG: CoA transferase [Devosia sp.]|uniref:CaiB/BaiF CoA transferase family protein n=1 Tax=Devosia sp. TaxID=1871048 RepID=UPI0019FC1C24|nr:CoA transferase [Devosia sp.]MBF0679305.1 CoA transferase [Devosia sp.]
MSAGPLHGIRVLDVTTAWAGPFVGRVLAALGADVVHVEAAKRMDLWRGGLTGENPRRYPDGVLGERPYDRTVLFNSQNLNKRSLCIDIKSPGGREALKAAAANADVIVSNFTPGTLSRMGLDYAELSAINPRIILVEMPAFGTNGPMAKLSALGPSMEFSTGMSTFIGYGDGAPTATGPAYLDPIGGYNGAAAIMTALHQREQTGHGQYVEISQVEAAMPLIGGLVLGSLENDEPPCPQGNRQTSSIIHDAFRCRGSEEWVAINVQAVSQWRSLALLMGRDDLADLDLSTEADRARHADQLHGAVAAWTENLDKHWIAPRLQRMGIAAAPVCHGKDVALDPHLHATDFFEEIEHPEAGLRPYQSLPFRFAENRLPRLKPAPMLGQHTREVLREWAGLKEAELDDLAAQGTTSNDPYRS